MPVCQNCQIKWNWKETFKRSFTLASGMTCPYCSNMQYYSARFRKRSSIIPFIIIVIMMMANLIFGPSYLFLGALLGFIPLYTGIYPFFVELSNEEETFR